MITIVRNQKEKTNSIIKSFFKAADQLLFGTIFTTFSKILTFSSIFTFTLKIESTFVCVHYCN